MSPTIDDIIAARDAAVNIIDQEITDALAKKNAAASDAAAGRFDTAIHQLMVLRVAIFAQAADEAMQAPQLEAALNTLRGITSNMSTIAARMGSVTGFFNNISNFLNAASEVEGAIKGS
jgi:hypothetical protein